MQAEYKHTLTSVYNNQFQVFDYSHLWPVDKQNMIIALITPDEANFKYCIIRAVPGELLTLESRKRPLYRNFRD